MFLFFSESGYRYGHGYGYGGYRNRYRYHYYGKRGMKKIASRHLANNVHAELNDDARTEHLKENLAEVGSEFYCKVKHLDQLNEVAWEHQSQK